MTRPFKFLLVFAAGALFAFGPARAESPEEPITFDRLPQESQLFLKTHFDTLRVAYIVADHKIRSVEYEVTYTDRTEVEFRGDGLWKSVERRSAPVPAAIVPKPVADFVADDEYARHQFIRKIERNLYTWEIELSGGLEITFDSRFNVIDYDD